MLRLLLLVLSIASTDQLGQGHVVLAAYVEILSTNNILAKIYQKDPEPGSHLHTWSSEKPILPLLMPCLSSSSLT